MYVEVNVGMNNKKMKPTVSNGHFIVHAKEALKVGRNSYFI